MKQHPIYFGLVVLSGLYLLLADVRGWSLMHSITTGRLLGGHGSSFAHK